jgi:hypothetical protein
MAKTPPERLAAALKANLQRRKQAAMSTIPAGPAKDPEKSKEKRADQAPRSSKGT